MVVVLVVAGRGWDSVTGPTIGPEGLLGDPVTAEEDATAQAYLRTQLEAFGVPAVSVPEDRDDLDPAWVLSQCEASYILIRGAGNPDAATDEDLLAMRDGVAAMLPRGVFQATCDELVYNFFRVVRSVMHFRPQLLGQAARDTCVRIPATLWERECAFTIVFGVLIMLIFGMGGGALSRMAVCDAARREHLRGRDAVDFALENWVKLVLAPFLPLLIAGAAAIVLVGLGLLFAPWLDVIGGPLYGLGIVFGFLLAFLLLGYAVGFPLLVPAIAAENCDAADAQQRAYAYVLNRPLHMIGYVATGLVGLTLGYFVVAILAVGVLNFTAALMGAVLDSSALVGAGGFRIFDLSQPTPGAIHETWHDMWAAMAVSFWKHLIIDLVVAWVVSYFFSCSTTIYLLMRRACDGQDMQEIWRPGLTPGSFVPVPGPEEAPADK